MWTLFQKYRKLLGFVVFGSLAGMVYAVILVASIDILGLPTFFGSAIAFTLALPVSYFGNRLVTYRSYNILTPEIFRFLIAQMINIMLTSALVHLMVEQFTLPAYAAIIAAFIVAPIISLILFELWVYRQRQGVDTLRPVPPKPGSSR